MKKFRFKKIDAFASGLSSGNPAGAIYINSFDEITEAEMQRIAFELKDLVREVGYIAVIGDSEYRLRYFSAEREVEFCGHATIGIMYDLLKSAEFKSNEKTVFLHTNKGRLDIENRIDTEDSIFITAPLPVYTDCVIPAGSISSALNIEPSKISNDLPTGIVNAGNQTLCVPLSSIDDVLTCSPDYQTLKRFCLENNIEVITVYTNQTTDILRKYRSRVFAAPYGYLEDPATGSGNAALAYHLHRTGLWDGSGMVLEQNNDAENPNIISLASKTDEHGNFRVKFGGRAITRIDGCYILHSKI